MTLFSIKQLLIIGPAFMWFNLILSAASYAEAADHKATAESKIYPNLDFNQVDDNVVISGTIHPFCFNCGTLNLGFRSFDNTLIGLSGYGSMRRNDGHEFLSVFGRYYFPNSVLYLQGKLGSLRHVKPLYTDSQTSTGDDGARPEETGYVSVEGPGYGADFGLTIFSHRHLNIGMNIIGFTQFVDSQKQRQANELGYSGWHLLRLEVGTNF